MFILDTDRVPVQDGKGNTVYVRRKMSYGIVQRVQSAATRVTLPGKNGAKEAAPQFDLGAYNSALLVNNILAWEGPDFANHACTPQNILSLDPDEPIVTAVLEKISELNTRSAADPKESTNATAPGSGAFVSSPATTTSTSG